MEPMETEKKVVPQDVSVELDTESTELSDTELDDVSGGEGGSNEE